MQQKVILKAEGDNASGKSYLLSKINEISLKEKHEIVIMNNY
jgi:hypothetical protein